MICGVCGRSEADAEFTRFNISGDGMKGLCKKCKNARDLSRLITNKEFGELPDFELTATLLKRCKVRIGVLNLHKIADRSNTKNIPSSNMLNVGLRAILKELNEPHEYCDVKQINDYEFVLISLTSVMDIENLIYTFEKHAPANVTATVIVGGFGVCNIKVIVPYIDIAVFGRGEGQINEIIDGKRFDNVWRKADDPIIDGRYAIRQTQYLVEGELGVGCRNRCRYCQYTHIRLPMNSGDIYTPGAKITSIESDWNALDVTRAGRYTTAWDGWSDQTRARVCKPVTSDTIINKLIRIGNMDNITGAVNIKIFQIVGYPWETRESVADDMEQCKKMFKEIDDNIKNKVVLSFLNTPFGPEPITPMQYDPANINISWPEIVNREMYYVGKKLLTHIVPFTSGAFALLKRVFIHRAETKDAGTFKRLAFSNKLGRLSDKDKVEWLLTREIVDKKMFGQIDRAAFDYLIPPR